MSGLAFVGRVEQLSPIDGADRIESAEVVCGEGGRWSGVVKKGEYLPGSRCTVYLQDAVVQPSDELSFLKGTNWRVKMQRFRGAPSECVIMPASNDGDIGTDLTDVLGVRKYEKVLPALLAGNAFGSFPSFLQKTDEPNYQTARRLVEALRGLPWYATVKCDGSSTTAYQWKGHFGVCSRNLELQDGESAFWRVANKYNLREILPDGIALQWETCGPGVQKNPMGMTEIDGFAFQAFDIENRRYLDFIPFQELCNSIGFPIVPHAWNSPAFAFTDDDLREHAEGTYPNGKQREGIVIRPATETKVGQLRLSFKVINLLYKD